MQGSKFGFILLAAVAFATPACFSVDKDDDDDDGGESGEGSGGSSSGNGGSSGKGGSSGSSGSGGSSGGGNVCDLSDYEVPTVACPAGSVSFLDDPVCNAYFSCLVASGCGSAGSECEACVTYAEDELASQLYCYESGSELFAQACVDASQDTTNPGYNPDCVLSN